MEIVCGSKAPAVSECLRKLPLIWEIWVSDNIVALYNTRLLLDEKCLKGTVGAFALMALIASLAVMGW